jgi:hypothetical protein
MGSETSLILSLIFGSIGLGFFIYGKKGKKTVPLVCGIALMVYPYFVENIYLSLLTGVTLCLLPFFVEV